MKLKNTLGLVIGSIVAASSLNAMAQGQGAVEVEAFGKRVFTESNRDASNGNLFGGSIGYFLTDDVSLNLSHGVYRRIDSDDNYPGTFEKKRLKGHLSTLEAVYHFGTPGANSLRPYISGGFGHEKIDNTYTSGKDKTTFAMVGAGLKYYISENFLVRAGVDVMHSLDTNNTQYMAGLGVGLNFGGGAAAPAPVAETVYEPAPVVVAEEEAVEVVRVELDVKFDFDKAVVKQESYGDIQVLADFMKQYPVTTTTVEGHTDSVGSDAYNLKLSERRAAAVRNVLVNDYGVAANRVNAVGYGESNPIASNDTAEGRAINRRVEAEVEAQVTQVAVEAVAQ